MTNLTLRRAVPQDAPVVVPLMHDSSPGPLDVVFGHRAPAFLTRDFHRGHGIYGYTHQLLAVTPDDEIVATLTAYPGSYYQTMARHTLRSAARALGPVRFPGALRRAAQVQRLFIAPSPDAVFLANLCVAAQHRSRGHGSMMLRHAIRTAGEQGLRRVQFDVSWHNARAQQLYERLGFTVTAERPDNSGRGIDGFRRMELTIENQ
ncbi:GNAT family N-acetyltransferase [Streptomyces sp. NPDC048419]|uniref:GNAT family N-acetyltransferase n=1 Tax=Streptomyces sp. NPDC048419 TaxID=3365547 RepID=UPI003717E2F4